MNVNNLRMTLNAIDANPFALCSSSDKPSTPPTALVLLAAGVVMARENFYGTPEQWLDMNAEQAAYLFAPGRTIKQLRTFADNALLMELFA